MWTRGVARQVAEVTPDFEKDRRGKGTGEPGGYVMHPRFLSKERQKKKGEKEKRTFHNYLHRLALCVY